MAHERKIPFSAVGQKRPVEKISDRLETAYNRLQKRFTGLNIELEELNEKLIHKVLELDTLSHYLNSILANITQGILFISIDGAVTTYNQAAESILSIPKEKVLYKPFTESFPDDLFGFPITKVLKEKKSPFALQYIKINNEKELEIDCTFVAKDETDNWEPTEGLPIQSTSGLILLVRDVTEFRRLETLAHRKSRMNELGEMASMVAHEIRNPLGGIKGFASLLERDLKDRPELQRMAAYIIQGTDNLNELVTRVLNYSRPLQTSFRSTKILPLLQELKEHILTDESYTQKVKVDINCSDEDIAVPLDDQSFRFALLNLMVNAIQAMSEGGTITITLDKNNGFAILTVSDTGCGIPPENIKKIFSPFFTTRSDGNGFGLSEVHKVVQAHEGTIEVDSVVNKGTTFTIKLPIKIQG